MIDELITTELKIEFHLKKTGLPVDSLLTRKDQLFQIVMNRLGGRADDEDLNKCIKQLRTVLRMCFDAQETVMNNSDLKNLEPSDIIIVAHAAVDAQKYNSERNILIRSIDMILDESELSPTLKTYK